MAVITEPRPAVGMEAARTIIAAHLVASPFLGGPERQMLGLTGALDGSVRSVFLGFAEAGRARPFLAEAARAGHETVELCENAPRYGAAIREVADCLRRLRADVLCCHGYKPDILGLAAARRVGMPVVAVSRGWTGATWKVRLNEGLDRLCLRRMDRVVCVSEGQAVKVRQVGVSSDRVVVIRNAIRADRFEVGDPAGRSELLALFSGTPPARVVGAAGRLSPEKGFGVLVEAAASVLRQHPNAGFVLFGDGPLRVDLERAIGAAGLAGRFVLAGFRDDLDRLAPHFDLLALPSFTEGLPNVALEAAAAGVAIVATAVGGTPEVVEDGGTGYLVPPGEPLSLAGRIADLLGDEEIRREFGRRGRDRIRSEFTFEAQAAQYLALFQELVGEERSWA